MRFKMVLTFTMVVLLSAVWLGCSKDSKITSYQNQTALVLSVLPADGSTSVLTTTSVTFQQGFLFLPGQRMQEFMDSLDNMHSDSDSMYMQQMYHQYCIQGEFHWNNQNDTCVFQPDSALTSYTEHMLYIMQHRDQQMHMHQHNGAVISKDFRSHFTTTDK